MQWTWTRRTHACKLHVKTTSPQPLVSTPSRPSLSQSTAATTESRVAWIQFDLHDFVRWVCLSLDTPNEFVSVVARTWGDERIGSSFSWLREDVTFRPYHGPRLDFSCLLLWTLRWETPQPPSNLLDVFVISPCFFFV